MKMILVLGGLAAAAALAACTEYFHDDASGPVAAAAAPAYATPAAYSGGSCFYTRDIRNHTIGGPHTIYLNVNGRQVFRVEAGNDCAAGAVSSDPLVIRNEPAGISVCKPIDFDVAVHMTGGFSNRCIVTSITPMSPAEVAALPRKLRP